MDASRLRAVTLLILTFAAGAAIGVAGDRLELIPGVAQATETGPGGEGARPEGRRDRRTTIEKFADDLDLTEDQRGDIEEFLDYYRSSVRSMRLAVRPQYRSLLDSVRIQIESVLSDHQVEEYRALLEERYGDYREQRQDQQDQN